MRRFKYFIVFAMIVISSFLLVNRVTNNPEKKVMGLISPIVEITQYATPSAEPTATVSAVITLQPTATETPTPTKKPTPKPVATPTMALSQEVSGFIDRFSGQYGVDPNVIRHLAICESGYRSNATNGPYIGLFQFGSITWQNFRKEMGEDINPELRYSAEESVQTAAYALSKGKGKIWPNCMP